MTTNHQGTRLIQIDASSHCQLACPSCPTATGLTRKSLGAGHLDVENFRRLLDANPSIEEVELSNYGEMFLNPRLLEILRIASERQVVLHADNGVNLNHASDAILEALVQHRFRSLTVSIDGASAESYRQYRIKGDFDRVIANIRRLNELKQQHRAAFPILKWQFVVFGHNEHEIAAARDMAKTLGMSFLAKLSWDDDVSPIRNRELVQIQMGTPLLSREEFHRANGVDYMRGICLQLWHAPVLNWDGRVTGCCRNFWGEFGGNAFTDGMDPVLDSEGMRHAKKMLTEGAEPRPEIPCTTCDLYRTLAADRRWLTREEIAQGQKGSSILLGVVVERELAEIATHADVFIAAGSTIRPELLVRPPPAARIELASEQAAHFTVHGPGDYTIYVLPRKLDPTFRKHYPPLPPRTLSIKVPPRPVCKEYYFLAPPDHGGVTPFIRA